MLQFFPSHTTTVKDDNLESEFDFEDEDVEEIYFDTANFNYHYGADGFLYATGKTNGNLFVLIDAEWHDVQSAEFDMYAMQEDFSFDSSENFPDDFPNSEI